MKRKSKTKLRPFRFFPHIMERRMKRGYRKAGSVNLTEAEQGLCAGDLCEYEKWLVKQTES